MVAITASTNGNALLKHILSHGTLFISIAVAIVSTAAFLETWLKSSNPMGWSPPALLPVLSSTNASSLCATRQLPKHFWNGFEEDPGALTAAMFTAHGMGNELQAQVMMVNTLQMLGYAVIYYAQCSGCSNSFKKRLLEAAGALSLHIEPSDLLVRSWGSGVPRSRLFLLYGNSTQPQFPGIGIINIYLCNTSSAAFPSSEGTSNSEMASTLETYDYVLLDSTESLHRYSSSSSSLFGSQFSSGKVFPNLHVLSTAGQNHSSFQKTFDHLVERGLSSRRFRYLVANSLPAVKACATTNISAVSPFAAVIVEARSHWALEYVIYNTMAVLSLSKHPWALHIYYSDENAWLISALASDARLAAAQLHQLELGNADVGTYNDLMLSTAFWNSLGNVRKALIFQTDSLLLQNGIDSFLGFDYIGAPWHLQNDRWETISRWVPQGVGNGGLSLRSVALMRQICRNSRPEFQEQEDTFFARNVLDLLGNSSTRAQAYEFALEFPCLDLDPLMQKIPVAIHAAWYYHPRQRSQALLERSLSATLKVL